MIKLSVSLCHLREITRICSDKAIDMSSVLSAAIRARTVHLLLPQQGNSTPPPRLGTACGRFGKQKQQSEEEEEWKIFVNPTFTHKEEEKEEEKEKWMRSPHS